MIAWMIESMRWNQSAQQQKMERDLQSNEARALWQLMRLLFGSWIEEFLEHNGTSDEQSQFRDDECLHSEWGDSFDGEKHPAKGIHCQEHWNECLDVFLAFADSAGSTTAANSA